MPPAMVDTEWFHERIRQSPHRSLRGLARSMRGRGGHPFLASALSLMLRGKREMRMDEARQLAELLDAPLIEVLRRAGLPL